MSEANERSEAEPGADLAQTDERYGVESIQILEGIEAVRKRPAMYIGDTASTGLHHLVYEVVDNSIDEALAGRCDAIIVRLNDDGSCSVTDNGAGIPVGLHQKAKKSTLEVVMTVLHAGGKFEREGESAYKVSGGLHGVGVSCVNALSEWLEAEVYRRGHVWTQRYEAGRPITPVENLGKTDRRGTRIVFKPDPAIFEVLQFDYDRLAGRLRQLAFLNRGIRIEILDERCDPSRGEVFHYAGGIEAFVRYLSEGQNPVHPEVIFLQSEEVDAGIELEVAVQYNESFQEQLYTFVNNIHTIHGGTHLSGFRAALTRQFNRFAQEIAAKNDKIPSGEDYREGLTCVLSLRMPEPQFEGQTKTKLGNHEIQGLVEALVNQGLQTFIEENPGSAKAIAQRAMRAARVRDAVRKARDLARRKGALSHGGLPGKLWDCSSRAVEETEIFIVEGDSAGGSAKQGRDYRTQAILPIKGKILNVEKATLDKLLGHEEIKTIISALGTGFHDDFSLDKLRYGKVIIMTDADVDGSHIRTLLLTFFYRHMHPLIEAGRIFAAQPPLYRIKRKRHEQYVLDDTEFRSILLTLGVEGTVLEALESKRRLEGQALVELLGVLEALEEHVRYIHKRGVSFERYLAARTANGELPIYFVRTAGEEQFLHGDQELEVFLERLSEEGEEPILLAAEQLPGEDDTSYYWKTEFLSKRHIEATLKRLESLQFDVEHYFPADGDDPKPRYLLHYETQEQPVGSLKALLEALRKIGQKGLDIQRYKGLGEMNPDQLWETTMDPLKRSLVRIRLVDAAKANNMFSVLMGENVEPRRAFIERHALDVKDLDV
ncbi:DNA topoisomerase (ATP-hydrolyzing) subunit B [Planctomycetota bacterium]